MSNEFRLPVLPDLSMRCDAHCRDCCFEPVPVSEQEMLRLVLYANERDIAPERGTGMCPWWGTAEGRCLVYEARPIVCRVFGHLEIEGAVCSRGYNEDATGETRTALVQALSERAKGAPVMFLPEVLGPGEDEWKSRVEPDVWAYVNEQRKINGLSELTRPGEAKGG